MSQINIQRHQTIIGELILGSSGGRLCLLGFGHEETTRGIHGRIRRRLNAGFVERDDEVIAETRKQIDEYLNGRRREFDIPLLMVGSEFQKSVWNALMRVPYGTTASYLQIARAIGNEKAVRAVGSACKANPIAIIVPCHRIIGSDGGLGGYGGGLTVKEKLLRLEQRNYAWCDDRVDATEDSD